MGLFQSDVLVPVFRRIERAHLPELPTCAAAEDDWTLPGFAGKTRIRTTFGDLPVEALRVNDPLVTPLGRVLKVRRIDRIGLDRGFLLARPSAQPVLIPENALGRGLPMQDMLVSPAQELELRSATPQAHKSRADRLTRNPLITTVFHGVMTYFTLDLGEDAVILAEGVPVRVPMRNAADRDAFGEED